MEAGWLWEKVSSHVPLEYRLGFGKVWEMHANVFHTLQHILHLEVEEERVKPGGVNSFGGSALLRYLKPRHPGELTQNLFLQ